MHHYHKKLEVHQTQHAVGGEDLKCENDSICAPSAQLWGRPRITRSPLFFPLLIWASERKHESKFIKQHCMNSASFADTCFFSPQLIRLRKTTWSQKWDLHKVLALVHPSWSFADSIVLVTPGVYHCSPGGVSLCFHIVLHLAQFKHVHTLIWNSCFYSALQRSHSCSHGFLTCLLPQGFLRLVVTPPNDTSMTLMCNLYL